MIHYWLNELPLSIIYLEPLLSLRSLLTIPVASFIFLCRYAKLEERLGEIDRARAIFTHASQVYYLSTYLSRS